MDSIRSYIKYGSIQTESIEGRIKDARVYLALLRDIIERGNLRKSNL